MYDVNLINKDCSFDHAKFSTVAECIVWASRRGGKYTANITNDDGDMVMHLSFNNGEVKEEVGPREWQVIKMDMLDLKGRI